MTEIEHLTGILADVMVGRFSTDTIPGVPTKYNELNRHFLNVIHNPANQGQHLDDCCRFAVENFSFEDETATAILYQKIRNGAELCSLDQVELAANIDGLIAIFAMRGMLQKCRITFNVKECQGWSMFIGKFKNVVLENI